MCTTIKKRTLYNKTTVEAMSESGVKCQRGELYRFLSGRFEHARLDHGEETSSGYRCVSGLDKSNPIIRIKLLVIGAALYILGWQKAE